MIQPALEVEAHGQTEVHSFQGDQCATQVDQSASQVGQSASQVDQRLMQVEENAGCPSLARPRGAACLAELQSCSEAILPVGVLRGASPESGSCESLLHEALDPHRRVVSGGRQANPVSQCPGHREGEQTLPTREPPSCVVRAKGLACSWKTKSLKQAPNCDMHGDTSRTSKNAKS